MLALSLAWVGGGGVGGLAWARLVVGEVGIWVDLVVVGELRELGLVDGVGGRGRGRGRERAERGDGVGHVGDGDGRGDELDGAEDACDDEELIEPCPKREKRKLDRASLGT